MAAKGLLLCTYDSPAFFMEICKKQVGNKMFMMLNYAQVCLGFKHAFSLVFLQQIESIIQS